MASTEFELWAGRLLESSPGGSGWHEVLQAIYPQIATIVARVCGRWGRKLPMEPEDLVHEVFLRIEVNPPRRAQHGSAAATVGAWIRVTAYRILVDASRGRELAVEVAAPQREDPTPTPGFASAVEKLDLLDGLMRYLAEHYPPGARLLELIIREQGLTSKEQAERLGLSPANVDQIRSRLTNVWLVRFQENAVSKG